ncbi:MAG: hypothetical protein ABSE48_19545 [Verrucomicrobiota bacterium]|jgi:hypothetical protein
MKTNSITSALLALGVVSIASAAQANTTVYLVGASALRSTIYQYAQIPGAIFDADKPAGIILPAGTTSGAANIVYEGYINGNLVDIDAYWAGAEAAIADAAGHQLTETIPANATLGTPAYSGNLPGVPGVFLNPNSTPTPWTGALVPLSSIPGAPSVADLALDDTSQAVSYTPAATYPLTTYGAIAVVPFSFLKGYEKTPDAPWTNIVNVTTAQINTIYTGPQPANFVTGKLDTADTNDSVVITGRNYGSGTRVNALLTAQVNLNATVDQWAVDPNYTTPGLLGTDTAYSSPSLGLVDVGNDGFNASGQAADQLAFDLTGEGGILIEPLAVPDAATVHTSPPSGGGAPTYLSYNGVYESDQGVINGTYTFWGNENLYGSHNQSPTSIQGETGLAIYNGLKAVLLTNGAGTATGAVGPTYTAQSALIPETYLQVSRSGDSGFPTPALHNGI